MPPHRCHPRWQPTKVPPSLGFSRQEHWSELPFPSPMHESEKWKWSRSVVSDSSWPHGLQPTRLLRPWDFPGNSTGVGCHCLLLRIWSDLKKKKKRSLSSWNLYFGTYANKHVEIHVEDGKGYKEKSNWARSWGHSEWLNKELSILNQPFSESISDNWRRNLNKVKKSVMWSSLLRVSMVLASATHILKLKSIYG